MRSPAQREQLLEAVRRGDHRGPGVEGEAVVLVDVGAAARLSRASNSTVRSPPPAGGSPPPARRSRCRSTATRARSAIRRLQLRISAASIVELRRGCSRRWPAGRRARRADSWTPAAAPAAHRHAQPAASARARVPSPSSPSASATALACSSWNAAASTAGSTAASAHGQVGRPLRRSSSALSPVSGGGAVRLPKSSSICRPEAQPAPEPCQRLDARRARLGGQGAQQRRQLHQRPRLEHRAGRDGAIHPPHAGSRPAGSDRSSACPRWQ